MRDFMDDYHAYMSCCSEEETDQAKPPVPVALPVA